MGQALESESRFSSLSYSPVIESKGGIWSEDRTLYNTPVYTRPSDQHVFTSPHTKPMPRGLQIPANNTVRLKRGFPYPKEVLMCYGIDKNNWEKFQQAILASILVTDGNPKNGIPGRGVAYNVDKLLDCVAEWDVRFFRPKGIVMRMDMPGEEKYGLDFMDLYYKGQIINASGIGGREGILQEFKRGKPIKKRQMHIDRARGRGYCSTRIVLDPVEVLQNKQMADARGWTAWNQQCKEAQRRKYRPLPALRPNQTFAGDPRLRARSRTDLWPPCKHFYYDRFRGNEKHVKRAHDTERGVEYYGHSSDCKWIPEDDSMDQRFGGALYRCRILPADDLTYVVVDDKSSISIASLMTRAFGRNNGGAQAGGHWLAAVRGEEEQSTCPWPDFPWPQGKGMERLDFVDGCESCRQHHGDE